MTYKNYIFDFGEAVADLRECYVSAFSKAFSQFGIPFDEGKTEEYASVPLDVLFEKYHRGCTCRYRDFVIMFMGAFDGNFPKAKPRPGVKETFDALRNEEKKIGIISDCYETYVRTFLSEHGLGDAVSSVVGTERTAVPKPDPYVLNLCMGELSAERSDTVMVTDSEPNRETCRRAGISFASAVR